MNSPLLMTTNDEYAKVFTADLNYMHELSWPINVLVFKEDIIVDKENLNTFEALLTYLKQDKAKGFSLQSIPNLATWKSQHSAYSDADRGPVNKMLGSVMVGTGTVMLTSIVVPTLPLMASMVMAGIVSSYFGIRKSTSTSLPAQFLALSDELSLAHQADILSLFAGTLIPVETLMQWQRANKDKGYSTVQFKAFQHKHTLPTENVKEPTELSLWATEPSSLTCRAQAASTIQLLRKMPDVASVMHLQTLANLKKLEEFYSWATKTHPRFKQHFSFTAHDLPALNDIAKKYCTEGNIPLN